MAQGSGSVRNGAVVFSSFAFAGDHQNKPEARRMGVQDEADQLGMRLGQRHAMKVNAGFGLQLAPGHPGVGSGIHAKRRLAKKLGQRWRKVAALGGALLLTK